MSRTVAHPGAADPRLPYSPRVFFTLGLAYLPYVVLAVLVIGASLAADSFLTVDNILNVLRSSAVLGLVTLGSALVLLTGRLDLSVGATLSAGGLAFYGAQDAGVVLALLAGLAAGICVGVVNGFLTCYLGANSLIVTLGMASTIFGALLVLTNARFLSSHDPAMTWLGRGDIGGVPVPVILFVCVLVGMDLWLKRTPFGRELPAIGANEAASHASGLRVVRARFLAYVIAGALSALAGMILAARLNSAQPGTGAGYDFDAITAAVLGGVSLFGGAGSMMRAAVGVLTLVLLGNVLNLAGVPYTSQLMVKGFLFIGIVALAGIAQEGRG